jgi:hypothetical protein
MPIGAAAWHGSRIAARSRWTCDEEACGTVCGSAAAKESPRGLPNKYAGTELHVFFAFDAF